MIITVDTEQVFDINQWSWRTGNWKKHKTNTNTILNVKFWRLLFEIKHRTGCHYCYFSQHCTASLVSAITQEKEIWGTNIGKEKIKQSLFSDDMITYIENSKFYKIFDLVRWYDGLLHLLIINRCKIQ